MEIDNLIHNQLLAEALLTNEMQPYISICMKVKAGIILDCRYQKRFTQRLILIVLLLFFWEHFNDLFCAHLLQLF